MDVKMFVLLQLSIKNNVFRTFFTVLIILRFYCPVVFIQVLPIGLKASTLDSENCGIKSKFNHFPAM